MRRGRWGITKKEKNKSGHGWRKRGQGAVMSPHSSKKNFTPVGEF